MKRIACLFVVLSGVSSVACGGSSESESGGNAAQVGQADVAGTLDRLDRDFALHQATFSVDDNGAVSLTLSDRGSACDQRCVSGGRGVLSIRSTETVTEPGTYSVGTWVNTEEPKKFRAQFTVWPKDYQCGTGLEFNYDPAPGELTLTSVDPLIGGPGETLQGELEVWTYEGMLSGPFEAVRCDGP